MAIIFGVLEKCLGIPVKVLASRNKFFFACSNDYLQLIVIWKDSSFRQTAFENSGKFYQRYF